MSANDGSPFAELGLGSRLVAATERLGFTEPTPIQAQAIAELLAGRDVVGLARTGSGKTAAFGLPLVQRLETAGKGVRALILTPTRELAQQVSEAIAGFAEGLRVKVATIYGGAPFGPQLRELSAGADVVVGTPGRILDHLDRGTLVLGGLEVLVLDEADEMLRMGFIDDVERIVAASPSTRQVALFSATMPPPIRRLAQAYLREPVEIQAQSEALAVDHIEQRWLCVPERFKADALGRILALEQASGALVFTRTRLGAANLADALASAGVSADALHGDLPQASRERVLARLRARRLDVVVATDVAARGIDVDHLTLVVNHDLPLDLESYVHRIGRTGRAGRAGKAISLITPDEVRRLRAFERRLGVDIAEVKPPSEADIARARWARLRREVISELTTPSAESAHVERVLAELARHDAAPEAVMAAALRVIARDRDLCLDGTLDEQLPSWARREKPTKHKPGKELARGRRADERRLEGHARRTNRGHLGDRRPTFARGEHDVAADEAEIFLPIGKRRGVRPADLVGALAGDLGIAGSQIGRITVLDYKSFVRLPRAVVKHIVRERARVQVRGTDLPVVESRRPSQRPPGGAPSQ